MLDLFFVCLLIFIMLLISEFLWRQKIISNEISRKLVHIFSGVVVAFLPHFISYGYIQILSLAFLSVVALSLKLNMFKAIHSVKRITIGEVMYPIGIGVCALLTPEPWIFTVAILHLALADALAAIVGLRYGKKTVYRIFGHKKSWHGTLTFWVISLTIFSGSIIFGQTTDYSYVYFLGFAPLVLTAVENFSWWGIDNLTIPLVVVVLLSNF